jgi:DNA-binding CsgD family transcriptional regulator
MRTLLAKPDVLFRVQKFLLPLSGVLFLSTIYIVHVDFGKILPESAFTLTGFEIATFLLSYFWTWIEYAKVQRMKGDIILQESQKESSMQQRLLQLSRKEHEVIRLILEGKSNKEICSESFIEHSTLKSHINHIYKKLDVKSRKEMVLALK